MKTNFVNLELKSPIIIASSPATETIKNIMECWQQGAGAVILKTAANYHRMGEYQKRKWYWNDNGVWAQSSFEREIFTLHESCELIRKVKENTDFPVIASLTEKSWDYSKWSEGIQKLSEAGADMIQMDLFYISECENLHESKKDLKTLFKNIYEKGDISVIPKLNINFPVSTTAKIVKESGIKGVSLLDSVRVPPPVIMKEKNSLVYPSQIGSVGTSYFGHWQLPLTEAYLHQAVKSDLEVCAGGGICSGDDALQLLMRGAKTIQVATGILRNGFSWIKSLNAEIECFLENNSISLEQLHKKSKQLVMQENWK